MAYLPGPAAAGRADADELRELAEKASPRGGATAGIDQRGGVCVQGFHLWLLMPVDEDEHRPFCV